MWLWLFLSKETTTYDMIKHIIHACLHTHDICLYILSLTKIPPIKIIQERLQQMYEPSEEALVGYRMNPLNQGTAQQDPEVHQGKTSFVTHLYWSSAQHWF